MKTTYNALFKAFQSEPWYTLHYSRVKCIFLKKMHYLGIILVANNALFVRDGGPEMTKNDLRIPCMCYLCNGASKDYRTVRAHAKNYSAERPVYPEGHDEEQNMPQPDPVIQPDQPDPYVPDPPYPQASVADIVSHVEMLPNCHDPAYPTVHERNVI